MIRPDTIERLSERRTGTLRDLALGLGLNAKDIGLLSDILRNVPENVSRDAENRVRSAVGLPPIVEYTVPACPSCGHVHTGDCHGKAVAQVVILAPGEGVRAPRKPPAKWADYAVGALAQAIAQRRSYQPSEPRYYDRAGRRVLNWQEVGA